MFEQFIRLYVLCDYLQMLPRTAQLLAIFSVLMEMTAASPVYNMQPAYITATIGSTGRNIRNLPCISRKSNQSGVCMFAIDCLKANGTHLGTCIDRFYFGSCCHIAPLEEITENTIDAALIPSREPPHRITTQTPTPTPTRTTTTSTTASTTTTTTTSKPLVKEGLVITTTNPLQPNQDDPESYKITTFQTIDDVPVATTIRSRPTPSKVKSTPKPVQTRPTTTTKVTKAPQRPQTTPKPITTINRNTTQLVNATRPQTTTPRPRPKPTKPIRITKPQNSTLFINGTTPTPNVQKTTKVPTTRAPKPTKKPVVTKITLGTTTSTPTPTTATTKKPITTKVPVSVTTSKITTKPSTSTIAPITTTTATATTTRTTTLSNEVLVAVNASNLEDAPNVNGNPVTNEIEAPKPLSTVDKETTTAVPSLVTWSEINKNESNSDKSTTTSTTTTTTTTSKTSPTTEKVTIPPLIQNPDDWVPLTDNWVQLPSITTAQPENPDLPTLLTTTTSTENSVSVSSSEANQPETRPSSMEILTTLSLSSSSSASFSTESLPVSISSTEDASLSSSSVSTEEVPLPTVDGQTTAAPATSGLNMSDFTDVCGRRMVPEGRIVGGEKSAFGKWPWQISLRQWRTSTYLHKCGAALLNENWAITAAHCVDNVPPSDLLLRLGEHDLSTEAEPYLHQERRVQIVASHPQFDPRTFEYDLALLRFYEPVTFQPNIIPVCVPQTDENFVGRNAHVTGWGRLYEDGPLPSVLQEVSVPVINNTVCESMYRSAGYIEHIPNIFICAGWRRGGFDSCEGDSGGPMVIQRQADKRFVLAGVISWGIGCAEPNQPGVYTRISEFRDWINQILQF